ncbi:hypothetical protein D3P08_22950 [Paenibacillus nanensis]|uniref:Copper amine oxidase-like N-terminal domain-containing protein n=1 Tax=Paenibacillus nanensis TaxID=393251 RepID=A0A3A1UQ05_9BACL|nr:beta-propeller domain-containing protein [Paenibacillus nanensis]RIX49407.1 hypothetical protein D3P08_22950 [Paenibacillus nanensis]
MRKKAIIAACLTLTLCVAASLEWTRPNDAAAAQSGIQVLMEGRPLSLSTPAFIENGSTLVPVREIAEALGAEVQYAEADGKRTVRLTRGEREALLTLGSKQMVAGGKRIQLDVEPRSIRDITMVPLRAISESLGTVVTWDGIKRIVSIDEPLQLPTVGTEDKLLELLHSVQGGSYGVQEMGGVIVEEAAAAPAADKVTATDSGSSGDDSGSSGDHSRTIVQVEGVDEADWVKTDGHYIYQISGTRVMIADISDPAKPRLAAKLEYGQQEGFRPQQLYIDEDRLLVIGNVEAYVVFEEGTTAVSGTVSKATPDSKMIIGPPSMYKSAVRTYVYDLSEDGAPTLIRQLEQEGSYLSSRKIGDALYMVTNKYTYPIYALPAVKADGDAAATEQQAEASKKLAASFEPLYRDTAVSDKAMTVKLKDVHYFPNPSDSTMMLVGAVDLNQEDGQLQVSAYLGAGETIYASRNNLYAAQTVYTQDGSRFKQETKFHKFRLDHGNILYISEGSVPGQLLNQFSMDEHEGYFRVALTNGNMWASGEGGSTNNVYVLNEKLETVGKLEGLAPGERIYSVRFMGKRAYMVTFRNVDPLFAIDLSNPVKPAVLGQLKIPGYSDYLHPYDENHLIGFGKDTVELPSKGAGADATTAYYQGLKIALFDVSDVSRPKELFKEIVGDRGTHSELLQDHKALLFSKEKGLLAFPVELHELSGKDSVDNGSFPAYGEFTYQGAYVYGIDLKNGFQLRGRISHLTNEDLKKSGQYGYDYRKQVRRILYAGSTLYTMSEAMLKANDIGSLKEQGSLDYPYDPDSGYRYSTIPVPMDVMPSVTP